MYDTRQVGLILQKEEMEVPDKEEDEDDEDFRERLIKVCCLMLMHTYCLLF